MSIRSSFGVRFVLFVCTTSLLIAGCSSKKTGKKVESECNIPSDQSGTISGRWPATPIPLAFREGHFSSDEMTAITDAVDTWNEFYNTSRGFPLMDYGDKGSPQTSTESQVASLCATGLVSSDNQFTGRVVIHKVTSSWAYGDDVVALTSFCPIPDTPFNRIYTAMMELNYEGFFVDGRKLPDLESIMLHEFGHLIGLNHSCETTAADGVPDCNASDLNPDYFYAVMFPVILFPNNVNGEERRDLQSNDQSRANCLYE